MDETPATPSTAAEPEPAPAGPATAPKWQPPQAPLRVDELPYNERTRTHFNAMSGDDRAAAYLASIRRMMVFFVTLSVIALVAAVIVGVLDIQAINSLGQPSGYGLGQ